MTVPPPVPVLVTVNENVGLKVATMVLATSIVTWQVLGAGEPVHATGAPEPPHPVKTQPAAGTTVSVTCVPAGYAWVQSLPQSTPTGLLVTVPLPDLVTVRVKAAANV